MVEEWRSVVGYEGMYEVSSAGRVKSTERRAVTLRGTRRVRERIMKTKYLPSGYEQLKLSKCGVIEHAYVHAVVLSAFAGAKPFPDAQTRHLDGNPRNNSASNLAWGDAVANAADKVAHGTTGCGEKGSGAKLTQVNVDEIRTRLASGEKQSILAAHFRVSRATVCMINAGSIWR